MGESVATVLVALAVQLALGVWVRRSARLAPLGLAEPLVAVCFGAACIAIAGALLAVLDVALTIPMFGASAAAVAFVLGRVVRTVRTDPSPAPAHRPATRIDVLWWLVAAAWCVLAFDTLAVANALPIFEGDEAGIWAAKAKAIHGTLGSSASLTELLAGRWAGARTDFAHPDYPWLGPLLQCWMHAFTGEVAHVAARVPAQTMGVCAVLATFELLRRSRAPVWFALALALALATRTEVLDLVRTAMSESLVCAGVVLLLLARAEAQRAGASSAANGALVLDALAAFVLVTAKNEGLALVACWAVARLVLVRNEPVAVRLRALVGLSPALAAAAVHWLYNARAGLSNDLVSAATSGASGSHVAAAVAAFVSDVLLAFERNALVPLLALLACAGTSAVRNGPAADLARFAAGLWCLASAAYLVTFATTPHDFVWHWTTAGPRIFANLLPAAAVALAWSAAALSRAPAED
jgi:hypothetical protein